MKGEGTETVDDKPSVFELRSIANGMDLKGKALVTFLVSSGCRIGFMSYEARDFLKEWLKVKDQTKKRFNQGD